MNQRYVLKTYVTIVEVKYFFIYLLWAIITPIGMSKKIVRLLWIGLFLLPGALMAQTANQQDIPLKGAARDINVTKDNAAVKQLARGGYAANVGLIDTIVNHPNDYNPMVFFVLSSVLYKAEHKDEAAFWFYLAQLRTSYDLARCNDKSCAGVPAQLTSIFGPEINQYTIPRPALLEKIVDRMIEFVKSNKENYDQRWINLDGLNVLKTNDGAVDKEMVMSKPEKDWPEIKSKTIKTYYEDFERFISTRKK